MARKPQVDTTGDGGLFAALGGGFLCFLLLLGVAAAAGEWFGAGVGQSVLEVGLVVVTLGTVGLLTWTNRGGR